MATKGYYDNPTEALEPANTDLMGIQQGTTLADMKKITYENLMKPLDTAKADKDADAVAGHIAVFDADGNPIDGVNVPSDFEIASRKKTVWSTPTSDLNYASEKLVKDSLDANESRIAENESDIAQNTSDIGDLEIEVADLAGVGHTDETVYKNAQDIATLNGADTFEGSVAKTVKDAVELIDARLDTTELTLARQGQDLASVKQTLQQGNGATLDFSGIGSVALDARATGRANPTVEGLMATNIVDGAGIANLGTVTFASILNHKYFDVLHGTILTGTGSDITVTNDTGATKDIAVINLTGVYGLGSEPSASECAKIFSYFDGTKSIQLPARVRSVGRNLFDDDEFITAINNIIPNRISRYNYLGDTCLLIVPSGVVTSKPLITGIFKPSTQYTVSYKGAQPTVGAGTSFAFRFVYTDGTFTNSGHTPASSNWSSILSCVSEVGKSVLSLQIIFNYGVTTVIKDIQLELGSTATPYEPYTDSTIYIADNEEVRSVQAVSDTISVVNGEHMLTKKISTPVSVASGVAVNVTNYPTAKTGGKFTVELTAGGTQIGIIGTDSTSGVGMLRYELATPIITLLLTSGILQAKPKGTVYFEPYYEGSHQTNASSQITLPYIGTIDKLTGYDENLEPYEVPSTGYTLVGTTLTVTDALENEVFYVELSRAEPLAPEMSVNTLNNEQVIADTANGKFYKLVPTITNGSLVNQTPVEVV